MLERKVPVDQVMNLALDGQSLILTVGLIPGRWQRHGYSSILKGFLLAQKMLNLRQREAANLSTGLVGTIPLHGQAQRFVEIDRRAPVEPAGGFGTIELQIRG